MSLKQRLCGLLAALLCTAAFAADPYPNKPVMLMVPYPAGGASDGLARVYAPPMQARLGQPVLVENLGGATGSLAAQKVLRAPADGYYMFLGSPNELILAPLVNSAIKFKAEDFRFVQQLADSPLVLLARKDLSVASVDDFVDLARKAAAEGKPLSYGSVGVGSLYHIIGEHMGQRIGARLMHVPYKGVAPLMQDLGGGQIDFTIAPYQASMGEMAEQGRLKILANLGDSRSEQLKQIPTASESRQLKNFAFKAWAGLFVKKGTPDEVVQKLFKASGDSHGEPAVRAYAEAQSMTEIPRMSLPELAKFYEAETERYRKLAASVGVKP